MKLYDIILTILWIVMLSYNVIDLIFPHIFKGNLILRIQDEQLGRRIWRGLYWVFFIVIYIFITISRRYFIFFTVFSILQIIRENRSIEIREKGIYFNLHFYKFKRMISYTWTDERLLQLRYINIFKEDDYCNLEIKDNEMALKVHEVLQKYVKQE